MLVGSCTRTTEMGTERQFYIFRGEWRLSPQRRHPADPGRVT
jgi:hypothetical protein